MATVNVSVNGHAYVVGCEDGQEPHVERLAAEFDARVRDVSAQVGKVTELRLFLMAALVLADELGDARSRLAEVEGGAGDESAARVDPQAETRAAEALEAAAIRIEALALNLN